MKRRISLLLILGILLIVCSLCFVIVVQFQQQNGIRNCQKVVTEMEKLLPDRTPGIPDAYSDPVMPVLEIQLTGVPQKSA